MMRISLTSKSKLIVLFCLVGLLQGCTTRMVTDDWINNVTKESDVFRLVVGREWARVASGADWEKKKILKEQSEYYKVPLDFSKPEIHLDPILIKENFSKTMYHPVKNSLLPYKIEVENPNDHSNGKNRELYSAPNPDADSLIGWHEEGRYGYAYYDSSKNIVQVLYTGETCTFPEKTRLHYLDFALSNDGRSVALYERDEANTLWGVRIFRGCKEVLTKEIENKKIDANLFYDF